MELPVKQAMIIRWKISKTMPLSLLFSLFRSCLVGPEIDEGYNEENQSKDKQHYKGEY
jgi:hypothetical protein